MGNFPSPMGERINCWPRGQQIDLVRSQQRAAWAVNGLRSKASTATLWTEYSEQFKSFGTGPFETVRTLLWDNRFSLVTTILAGFGRASAEVGAVMIVGGNIDHVTRVMTTAIALETSKGDLALALGLGIILLFLALSVNAAAYLINEAAIKRHG